MAIIALSAIIHGSPRAVETSRRGPHLLELSMSQQAGPLNYNLGVAAVKYIFNLGVRPLVHHKKKIASNVESTPDNPRDIIYAK